MCIVRLGRDQFRTPERHNRLLPREERSCGCGCSGRVGRDRRGGTSLEWCRPSSKSLQAGGGVERIMARHRCRNSSAEMMPQPRMPNRTCRNCGTTFAAEILPPVNYGNRSVPKFVQGKNYGTRPTAIIPNVGVSSMFLGTRQAQIFSQSRGSAFCPPLLAEFRHHFCHLPYILAFGILALALTKFVCAS
jgi:hypothetical protein